MIQPDSRFATLYERAIEHYRANEGNRWVVPDSIPIAYFGDLHGYMSSSKRVITVGLNPSDREFEKDRFGPEVKASLRADTLERALSNYFAFQPYTRWFNLSFETLLQPLGCSFYGLNYPGKAPPWWRPQRNVALHTDLCSPLATRLKWSNRDLPDAVKDDLRKWGVPFWKKLVAALKPSMILISVRKAHRNDLGDLKWRVFNPFSDGLSKHGLEIARFGDTHIVWGVAGRWPFANLGREKRESAARAILAQPEFKPTAIMAPEILDANASEVDEIK